MSKNSSNLFNKKFINKHLEHYNTSSVKDYDKKRALLEKWTSPNFLNELVKTKETQMQGLFLRDIFSDILGYKTIVDQADKYNLKQEFNNFLDTSEADAALGFFNLDNNDVRVVVELKDASTNLDFRQNRSNHLTPVEQAFNYANKNGAKCKWVIVSNFIETRLYKSNSSLEYEVFYLDDLTNEKEFLRFLYFLSKDNLIQKKGDSLIDDLYKKNEEEGQIISKQFYKDYQEIRNEIFNNLKKNNKGDDLLFFTKAQKLLNRFIFICFCEDTGLLPNNIIKNLIKNAELSYSLNPNKLWNELKGLFNSINKGNTKLKINRYNGGLFKFDEELDSLKIDDEVLQLLSKISEYDFNSDLNVNILGHIFEQSITDIEDLKAKIKNLSKSKKNKKRKEDGIFYTPNYVTEYIVKQTVGQYLTDKKESLKTEMFKNGPLKISVINPKTKRKNSFNFDKFVDFPDDLKEIPTNKELYYDAVKELNYLYWENYEKVLKNIKICDPACGSGAFLIQCFNYLKTETIFVISRLEQYRKLSGQIKATDIDTNILQNNLFGVDVNPESVEITKLSLWLITAKLNQSLTVLDNNIKCGNSIINNPKINKDSFDWKKEFPEVFKQGGFDIVIGNPPYGARLNSLEKKYIKENYITTEYNFDTYKTFFELGFKILKNNGFLGFITPNTFFTLEIGGNKLRKFLFNFSLLKIVELFNVFPEATVEPVITIFKKSKSDDQIFESICLPRKTKLSSTFLNEGKIQNFYNKELLEDEKLIFNYRTYGEERSLWKKIKRNKPLKEIFNVSNGVKPYCTGGGNPIQTKEIVASKPYTDFIKYDNSWRPYIRGKYINRYLTTWDRNKEYIKYGEWLAEPRKPEIFFQKKIFIRQTGDELIATLDNNNVCNNTIHVIYKKDNEISLFYLLGLLNSTLLNWFYKIEHFQEVSKPLAEVKAIFIKNLPIAIGTKKQNDKVEKLVKKLLKLNKKRYEFENNFVDFLKDKFEISQINQKLYNFGKMSFNRFLKELKNHKVKLNLSQENKLYDIWKEKSNSIKCLTKDIENNFFKLDEIIFEIYDLSSKEKEIIKSKLQSNF